MKTEHAVPSTVTIKQVQEAIKSDEPLQKVITIAIQTNGKKKRILNHILHSDMTLPSKITFYSTKTTLFHCTPSASRCHQNKISPT